MGECDTAEADYVFYRCNAGQAAERSSFTVAGERTRRGGSKLIHSSKLQKFQRLHKAGEVSFPAAPCFAASQPTNAVFL
jgi:hypothetical protein